MADEQHYNSNIERTLGTILAKLDNVAEVQRERAVEARESEARTGQKIDDVEHRLNNTIQVNSMKIDKTSIKVDSLETRMQRQEMVFESFQRDTRRDTTDLKFQLKEIKTPVDQLSDLKRRLVGLAAIVVSVTFVATTFLHDYLMEVLRDITKHIWWSP